MDRSDSGGLPTCEVARDIGVDGAGSVGDLVVLRDVGEQRGSVSGSAHQGKVVGAAGARGSHAAGRQRFVNCVLCHQPVCRPLAACTCAHMLRSCVTVQMEKRSHELSMSF